MAHPTAYPVAPPGQLSLQCLKHAFFALIHVFLGQPAELHFCVAPQRHVDLRLQDYAKRYTLSERCPIQLIRTVLAARNLAYCYLEWSLSTKSQNMVEFTYTTFGEHADPNLIACIVQDGHRLNWLDNLVHHPYAVLALAWDWTRWSSLSDESLRDLITAFVADPIIITVSWTLNTRWMFTAMSWYQEQVKFLHQHHDAKALWTDHRLVSKCVYCPLRQTEADMPSGCTGCSKIGVACLAESEQGLHMRQIVATLQSALHECEAASVLAPIEQPGLTGDGDRDQWLLEMLIRLVGATRALLRTGSKFRPLRSKTDIPTQTPRRASWSGDQHYLTIINQPGGHLSQAQ